jgi:hypothetical protein
VMSDSAGRFVARLEGFSQPISRDVVVCAKAPQQFKLCKRERGMDTLVSTVIAIVGPYLAKGAEEFAKSAGSAAFDSATALFERLSRWWSHEPVAEAAAKTFSSDPERYAKVLSEQLAHDLAKVVSQNNIYFSGFFFWVRG